MGEGGRGYIKEGVAGVAPTQLRRNSSCCRIGNSRETPRNRKGARARWGWGSTARPPLWRKKSRAKQSTISVKRKEENYVEERNRGVG